MSTEIPADVRESAQALWDMSNADLDEGIAAMVRDIRERDDDAMAFGVTLVEWVLSERLHNALVGNRAEVSERKYGVFLAAMFRLGRFEYERQQADVDHG